MASTTTTAQESRTEVVSISCTPTEARAVKAIAALRNTPASDLLRKMRLRDIVKEYERVRVA